MPLFDFHCAKCECTSEMLVRHDAEPACPQCGHPQLQKLMAKPAAPGTTKELIGKARRRAKAEGHFSNY
ncbi:MAG TPA: FmdB family zinc ribbon protein [Rhodocyclaceae bacterium]